MRQMLHSLESRRRAGNTAVNLIALVSSEMRAALDVQVVLAVANESD